MEILLEGNKLILRDVAWKEIFPSIDKAVREADVLVGIRVEKKEITMTCYLGSEERLQKVAALLEGGGA